MPNDSDGRKSNSIGAMLKNEVGAGKDRLPGEKGSCTRFIPTDFQGTDPVP